jgi:GntR family transcriptional regulator
MLSLADPLRLPAISLGGMTVYNNKTHSLEDLMEQLPQSSNVPLYTQIKETLRAKIIDGTYVAHQRLPSESEMINAFGVSRITVRQAMNDLQKEGLLFKVHGKGTFVAMPKVSQELTHLQGFGEAMRLLGHETFSEVFGLAIVVGTSTVCEKLGLRDGERVVEIRRIRYLNREPVSIDYSWVRRETGSKLSERNLRDKDLFSLLENELGQPLHSADVEIDATSASIEIAERLKVEPGSPILRIERLTYASLDKPLVFEYLHYRAESFKYKLKVLR